MIIIETKRKVNRNEKIRKEIVMDKRILSVQDISCLGQCSLTVALPIISACGVETCILPSAVLSTHTGGFTGFTFRDLTDDIPAIAAHWQKEGITFDGIYTGYLGSARQIDMVKDLFGTVCKKGAAKIVDPAMADHGRLYTGFDLAFAKKMATLCAAADIVLPNITEACFMTDTEYRETLTEDYVHALAKKLLAMGVGTVVLTGIGYEKGMTGVAVYTKDTYSYYPHPIVGGAFHGTGDVFASAFTGAFMQGKTAEEASRIAADFTVLAIQKTVGDESHKYGVKFEKALYTLAEMFAD